VRRVTLRVSAVLSRSTAGSTAGVSVLYAGLVLLLWLPYGYRNGMGYELAFPWSSETQSFLHGFFYSDSLRPFTSVFYQVGYKLSAALGIAGSFLGYQLVYAALWWARGILVYLIVDVVLPRRRLFAAFVGTLAVVHASDHALNWVGQLNQFGMMFWSLLGLYALVQALKPRSSWARTACWTAGAMLFTALGLWSYESPLFVLVITPLLLLPFRYGFSRRAWAIVGCSYLVPLLYVVETLRRYAGAGAGSSYQESVLRSSFPPGALLSDLWFNVVASLRFWDWGVVLYPPATVGEESWLSRGGAALFVVAFVVGVLVLRRRGECMLPSPRALVVLLGCGLLLLVASFPAYVILADARSLWRTQFLSSLAAALVFAAAAGLVACAVRGDWLRAVLLAAGGAAVVMFGVSAAYRDANNQYALWAAHKAAVDEVLDLAPQVRPGTLIALVGVPQRHDPFYDNNQWFDMAMRLAYPGTEVAGVYYYGDGTPAPDMNMRLVHGRWQSTGKGLGSLIVAAPVRHTVVIRFSPSGHPMLARRLPWFLAARADSTREYAPASMIEYRPVPQRVQNRYGTLSSES
jgi:hypothetical protein